MFLTRSSLPEQELTSVERFRKNSRFTHTPAYQGRSPLFSLPLEIRELIYIELFGSELVHVLPRQRGDKFNGKGAPTDANVSVFAHCVCCRGRESVPHYHEEKNHEWRFLSANLLKTCQSAYIEGIPILYRTNTLSFHSPRDMVFFQARVAPFSALAQFVDLYCAKTYLHNSLACDKKSFHPWALPKSQFDAYFDMIWLDKGLALNGRQVRLYFESEGTGNTYVASNLKTLLRPDVVPAANVQIFLQDSSNRIVGDDAKLVLTSNKQGSVTIITNAQIAEG
ncbi:hypothetical protein FHETE_3517 [Fusarium heterosporum]|uniref:DUF7730 domain-containing protein n=1 Tax=Fusarium heterosporum TaxID=42747 RepID=A0A8H5TP74_FUSHE|nr:hypothetical protein FHETE_3517 [Fusarium heterosporum]